MDRRTAFVSLLTVVLLCLWTIVGALPIDEHRHTQQRRIKRILDHRKSYPSQLFKNLTADEELERVRSRAATVITFDDRVTLWDRYESALRQHSLAISLLVLVLVIWAVCAGAKYLNGWCIHLSGGGGSGMQAGGGSTERLRPSFANDSAYSTDTEGAGGSGRRATNTATADKLAAHLDAHQRQQQQTSAAAARIPLGRLLKISSSGGSRVSLQSVAGRV